MTKRERLQRLKAKLAAIRDEVHVHLVRFGSEPSPGDQVLVIIGGPRHGAYTRAEAEEMDLWPPAEEKAAKGRPAARPDAHDVELPAGAYRSPRRPGRHA